MKTKHCGAVVVIVLLVATGACRSVAQLQKGMVELSCAGMYESRTLHAEGMSSDASVDYFSLSATPGYYLSDRISVEPELHLLFMKDELPSYIVSANLLVALFEQPGKTVIFLRAGYGIGNSIPTLGIPIRQSAELDIPVLNLGAGMKFFVAQGFAFRLEYRYQQFSYSSTYFSPYGLSQSRTIAANFSQLLIGLSVFLPSAQN